MKSRRSKIIFVILTVISIIAIGMTVEAIVIKKQQNNQPTLFDAEISLYLYEGYGCGCTPVRNASILATSGEGSVHQFTDDDGFCLLILVIDVEYRVLIEADGFQTITFDFIPIGDQPFTFHLEEEEESSYELIRDSILNIKKEIFEKK